jgi:hypothetical protein
MGRGNRREIMQIEKNRGTQPYFFVSVSFGNIGNTTDKYYMLTQVGIGMGLKYVSDLIEEP